MQVVGALLKAIGWCLLTIIRGIGALVMMLIDSQTTLTKRGQQKHRLRQADEMRTLRLRELRNRKYRNDHDF